MAIPVSIIATFALMYFCGFTLNLMTLGGLALGVGMLVDNSIVVLENIYRLREGGMPARRRRVHGSEEVTAAIIASTLTTLVVFLPLIFVRGMAGVMFKQLVDVVSFALLCSLVRGPHRWCPMLAAKVLRTTASTRDRSTETLRRQDLPRHRADVLRALERQLQGSSCTAPCDHRAVVVARRARAPGRQPRADAADRRRS